MTGAGSGIGRVSALLFAHEGAQVLAVDRVEAAVDETAQMIRKEGGAVSSVAADVSDEAAVKGFVDHCLSEFGGLNVVYANAGGTPYSASKAGVISLVQTAANEFYGTGVRVNAICPGLIETGMTKPIFDGARARGSDDKIGRLNPLKITTWR